MMMNFAAFTDQMVNGVMTPGIMQVEKLDGDFLCAGSMVEYAELKDKWVPSPGYSFYEIGEYVQARCYYLLINDSTMQAQVLRRDPDGELIAFTSPDQSDMPEYLWVNFLTRKPGLISAIYSAEHLAGRLALMKGTYGRAASAPVGQFLNR